METNSAMIEEEATVMATPATVTAAASEAAASSSSSSAEAASVDGGGGGGGGSGSDGDSKTKVEVEKLRRFLSTLVQFGLDIGPDAGDRVRDLVLRLLDSAVSIEEFHAELQGATNYPLRPFVIPFLRASLPLMQCELLHRARLAGRSPGQFLAGRGLSDFLRQHQHQHQHQHQQQHQQQHQGATASRKRQAETSEIGDDRRPTDQTGKQQAAVANGNGAVSLPWTLASLAFNWQTASGQQLLEPAPEVQRQARSQLHLQLHHQLHHQHQHHEQPRRRRRPRLRRTMRSPRRLRRLGELEANQEATDEEEETAPAAAAASATTTGAVVTTMAAAGQLGEVASDEADSGARIEEDPAAEARTDAEEAPEDAQRSGEAVAASNATPGSIGGVSSEWSRLEAMLATLADLVGRARKSLTSLQLQQRPPPPPPLPLHEISRWRSRDNDNEDGEDNKARLHHQQQSLHQLQLLQQQQQHQQQQQQHLGELVSAIRRQAQQEVRLAVAASEERAARLVSAEKLRMERLLAQAREEALAAARVQSGSAESCWNCGRAASETCSGCSRARYCGSFCQHKDWEKHQRLCGVPLARGDN